MSCFKLPKWLIERIDVIRRQFLWNRNGSDRPIHLINWQSVCLPIRCGGMGVTNLHLQNIALLLRWLWRLYTPDRKLWASYAAMIYAVRPQPDGPFFLATSGSFFWRAILNLKQLFHSAATFQPISGKRISFWFDKWMEQTLASTLTGPIASKWISIYDAKRRAGPLFPMPMTYFHHQVIQFLSAFNPRQGIDGITWNLTSSGIFSVKSIYQVLSQGGKEISDMAVVWKAAVTPSMRLFSFLLLKGRLLTHDVMHRRKLQFQPGCVMCNTGHMETAMHLFFTCPYANHTWCSLTRISGFPILSIKESAYLTFRASYPTDKDRCRSWMANFITALWCIWRERNERTFGPNKVPFFVLAARIQQQAELCLRYC